jgi:hypothetical protein
MQSQLHCRRPYQTLLRAIIKIKYIVIVIVVIVFHQYNEFCIKNGFIIFYFSNYSTRLLFQFFVFFFFYLHNIVIVSK